MSRLFEQTWLGSTNYLSITEKVEIMAQGAVSD
jgi:hypothetical protein